MTYLEKLGVLILVFTLATSQRVAEIHGLDGFVLMIGAMLFVFGGRNKD